MICLLEGEYFVTLSPKMYWFGCCFVEIFPAIITCMLLNEPGQSGFVVGL